MLKQTEINQKFEKYKEILGDVSLVPNKINILSTNKMEEMEKLEFFFKNHIDEIDKDTLINIVSLKYSQDKDFLDIINKKLSELSNLKSG